MVKWNAKALADGIEQGMFRACPIVSLRVLKTGLWPYSIPKLADDISAWETESHSEGV